MTERPWLLEMRGIEKSFPGVHAVKQGKFQLKAGEVHALLGENGAGKSTLIKILAGAHEPDSGEIFIDDQKVQIGSPKQAQELGIASIFQELSLVPLLTARENIFLGREKARFGLIARSEERRLSRDLFKKLNVAIDPEKPCGQLSVAEQQCVEIAKALSQGARILLMDEPTAALTDQEANRLFGVLREFKSKGIAVIYISHRLNEIFEICDRITVMRDGETVITDDVSNVSRAQLIEWMVGRTLEAEFPKQKAPIGEDRLVVRNLRRGSAVSDVSFSLRRGEVVGLMGLVGSGRTELARLIFGADRLDSGEIFLDGRLLRIRSPRDAIQHGICLLTEDRKSHGLVLCLSARENFGLPNLPAFSRLSWVDRPAETEAFDGYIEKLRIRIAGSEQLAQQLSGGNQQKVVLAKWLQSAAEVIIIDEPTRGIDVGAKVEIYLLINELAAAGKAILMISSELPEILGMSDRILVMREGKIAAEVTNVVGTTQERLMACAVGDLAA